MATGSPNVQLQLPLSPQQSVSKHAVPPSQPDPLVWIKFKGMRFHAVFAETNGGYWTYCQRFMRAPGVSDLKMHPKYRCLCCKGRLASPYLIPEELRNVRV